MTTVRAIVHQRACARAPGKRRLCTQLCVPARSRRWVYEHEGVCACACACACVGGGGCYGVHAGESTCVGLQGASAHTAPCPPCLLSLPRQPTTVRMFLALPARADSMASTACRVRRVGVEWGKERKGAQQRQAAQRGWTRGPSEAMLKAGSVRVRVCVCARVHTCAA